MSTLGTGTNKPILTRALSEEGKREDIVIKLMDSERMDKFAALRELTASFLALELGLNTPTPYLAEITDDFVDAQVGQNEYLRINKSRGLNFSTKNIVGLQLFGPEDILLSILEEEALKIFYFDLIIQNPDRTRLHGKPNLFTTGADLWILDHEIAFSFLVPIIGRPKTEPWEIHQSDTKMIENHILYRQLKGKKLNFSILDNYLDRFNTEFWNNLISKIPEQWMSNDLQTIVTHVNGIRENQQHFLSQVKTLLS